ncbi:hypothetical protein ACO0LG_17275 [Undibacterium sp. Ji42W]
MTIPAKELNKKTPQAATIWRVLEQGLIALGIAIFVILKPALMLDIFL